VDVSTPIVHQMQFKSISEGKTFLIARFLLGFAYNLKNMPNV